MTADAGMSIMGYTFDDDRSGSKDWNRFGDASVPAYWMLDSENLGIEASARFDLDYYSYGYESRGRSSSGYANSESDWSRASETYNASMRGIYFPTRYPISVIWSGNGDARISQGWGSSEGNGNSDTLIYHHESKNTSSDFGYNVSGEAGLGWGRVRDASGVYDAYIVEARLRDMGRINGELSQPTRQALTELFYKKEDYRRSHERYERFFWRNVENVLKSDPAMTGAMDAFALYRIAEIVAPGAIARWNGWRLSMTMAGNHNNSIYRNHSEWKHHVETDTSLSDTSGSDSRSTIRHSEQMQFGARLEVNIPLTWNIQLNGDTRAEHLVDPADDGIYWTTLLSGKYAIHDRWLARYDFTHERWINDPKDRNLHNGQAWTISQSASLSYFAEDNLQFSLRFSHYQNRAWDFVPNSPGPQYERHISNYSLRLGLTYLISGPYFWDDSSYLPRTGTNFYDNYFPRSYSESFLYGY